MAKQPLIKTTDLNIKMEAATEEINLFPENDAEEKRSIVQALKITHGNRKHAAAMLHIDPSTLYRKMKNECPHVTKLAKFKLPNCPTGMFWNTLCRI